MVERVLPLAGIAAVPCGDIELAVLPPATRLILRGDALALGDLDVALPEPCRAMPRGDLWLLWLGPDEFLLLAPPDRTPALRVHQPVSVVDISHRDTALSVSGARAAWAINAFCALDLHLSAFPVGMCTRTLFGKADVMLWRTDKDTFRLEVARSCARYVWACLEEARREFLA